MFHFHFPLWELNSFSLPRFRCSSDEQFHFRFHTFRWSRVNHWNIDWMNGSKRDRKRGQGKAVRWMPKQTSIFGLNKHKSKAITNLCVPCSRVVLFSGCYWWSSFPFRIHICIDRWKEMYSVRCLSRKRATHSCWWIYTIISSVSFSYLLYPHFNSGLPFTFIDPQQHNSIYLCCRAATKERWEYHLMINNKNKPNEKKALFSCKKKNLSTKLLCLVVPTFFVSSLFFFSICVRVSCSVPIIVSCHFL